MIEHNKDTDYKAGLVADPPGMGKTLISMMAMVKAIATARRFSIAVVPASCLDRWFSEFQKFFIPVRALLFSIINNMHSTADPCLYREKCESWSSETPLSYRTS